MRKILCCLVAGLLTFSAVCWPVGALAAAPLQAADAGVVIPEDTVLQLELLNFLKSERNKVGDKVSVKLLAAVSVADEVIISRGTVLEGTLKKCRRASCYHRRA